MDFPQCSFSLLIWDHLLEPPSVSVLLDLKESVDHFQYSGEWLILNPALGFSWMGWLNVIIALPFALLLVFIPE